MKTQLESLPKWAQERIKRLEARVEYLEKQADEQAREAPESPIKYQLKPGGEWYSVPGVTSYPKVRIFFDNDATLDLSVEREHPHSVMVMADYGVRVQPRSYNTLQLIPEVIRDGR